MPADEGVQVSLIRRDGRKGMIEPSDEQLSRLLGQIQPLVEAESSISAMAGLMKGFDAFPRMAETLNDIGTIHEWDLLIGEPGREMRFPAAFWFQIILVQQRKALVDSNGWYRARWYEDQYGILPGRLRQAKRRGQLDSMGEGRSTVYCHAQVQKLWPEDVQH